MERIHTGRTALITGASSGIGAETARLFAADGIDLALVGRDNQRLVAHAQALGATHGVRVFSRSQDLSKVDAALELCEWLDAHGIEVDYLINNAGAGLLSEFSRTAFGDITAMMRLNMETPAQLSRLLVPAMVTRGFGRILNVASLAAYQPGGPGATVYYATKAFLLSFSRALSEELKDSGVTVTALLPGPVATRFAARSAFDRTPAFNGFTAAPAESIAEAGYRAMHQGRRVCIPGAMAKTFAVLSLATPTSLALYLNRLFLKPR